MKHPVHLGKLVAAMAGVVALLGVAACAGGFHSDAPATQVYVLRAGAGAQTQLPRASAPEFSIHVTRPLAGPGLGSDHIMLVQSDHRMSYYAASRWPASVPEVVEALAVETLRTSGNWSAVQDSAGGFSSDYLLQIVIQRFEADYSSHPDAPEVHVVLDCTLGRGVGRELVGTFVAEGAATASVNHLTEVISAFEAAASQALRSMALQAAQKSEAPVASRNR